MDFAVHERTVDDSIIRVIEFNEFQELNELQLALIGGGIADVVVA